MSEFMQPALVWSIRESFSEYVLGIEDGSEALAGIDKNDAGEYEFYVREPANTGSSKSISEPISFRGNLMFSAYSGVLLLRFRELQLKQNDAGDLDFSIMHPAYPDITDKRVTIATLSKADAEFHHGTNTGYVRVSGPSLTIDGVRAFGDVYQVGSKLDSFLLHTKWAQCQFANFL